MDTSQFLFPGDLEVTPSGLSRILFIGSCLSEIYVKNFREAAPHIHFDHVLFNNAQALPAREDAELSQYDLQYVQLPLRSVLTDAAIRISESDGGASPIDWIQLGKSNIDQMLDAAMAYNNQNGMLSIVSTFPVPQGPTYASLAEQRTASDFRYVVGALNDYLASRVRTYSNAYVADVEMISAALGKKYHQDDFVGFFTHGSVHFPHWGEGNRIEYVPPFIETYENRLSEFLAAVLRQIEHIFRCVQQIDQVKLVIFDLDNTLWRGQIAENYQPGQEWPHAHGWPLGVWEAIQHLRWRGIAVSVASKNDHQVVVNRWADAVNPPFLKFEDFLYSKISWAAKAESVRDIMEMLSVTPKGVVFVDDHPVERESVKSAFPEIRVIGSNPYLTRRILLWAAETQVPFRTDESKRREKMLESQIERERHKSAIPREEFLASLDTKLTLFRVADSTHNSFSRVVELVNKTNQFNTTGIRWDVAAFESFWKNGGTVFAFSVSDKYTDYGLVGIILLHGSEILQYVMSCRVLGMDVEIAALGAAMRKSMGPDGGPTVAKVVPTDLNMPCRDVFTRSGFVKDDADDQVFLLASTTLCPVPTHVTVTVD
jgi:FkbH-like protein